LHHKPFKISEFILKGTNEKRKAKMIEIPILLKNRSVIAVTGEEARAFLHNIITADMEKLPTHAALLTPQGKIIADFFVSAFENGFYIECHTQARELLIKRLSLYKLRAKVEITPLDLKVYVSNKPIGFNDPRLKTMPNRFYGALEEFSTDEALYHKQRASLHLPDCFDDYLTSDIFPHEANMDKTHSVSFKKGCYVGQEVVSRMQHKTEIRKRFIGYTSNETLPPFSPVFNGERQIGVTGSEGLMLIRLDLLEGVLIANGVLIHAQP
jgi:tRNA-modifying protein YgfZ